MKSDKNKGVFDAHQIIKSAQRSSASKPIDFGLDISYLESLNNKELVYGKSIVFVTQFPDLQVRYVSEEASDIFGTKLSEFPMRNLLGFVHPEDLDFIVACEDKIFHFLFVLQQDHPDQYKTIYTVRVKEKSGVYHHYIKQAFCARHKQTGSVTYAVHVLTKCTHLRLADKYHFSLIDMMGGSSYYNIDPFKDYDSYLLEELPLFTKTEIKVISLVSEGNKSIEIADRLNVSEGTIRKHRNNILTKSGHKNMIAVVVDCLRNGLI